jgi:hypothetical protein
VLEYCLSCNFQFSSSILEYQWYYRKVDVGIIFDSVCIENALADQYIYHRNLI